jgi:hypothetical protein
MKQNTLTKDGCTCKVCDPCFLFTVKKLYNDMK